MRELQKAHGGGRAVRRAVAWLLLCACVLGSLGLSASAAHAQSGRRSPNISKSSPTTSNGTEAKGESESGSKPGANRVVKPTASFVVMDGNNAFDVDYTTRRIVLEGFARRLGQSPLVAVSQAGKGTRKEGRDRAKGESEAFVVLLELEEESADPSVRTRTRSDQRLLVIKTYVYAPATGDLKFTDRFVERPHRSSTTVGGVRVPVPSSRSNPSEQQLEQAGRDAADRLLSRFDVTPPRDN
ncbi:MAG: hypothetical protein H0T60_04245 [Acidobacteria bacterium]|nr:hypothetical protein [Acidobacteriota bacterium]